MRRSDVGGKELTEKVGGVMVVAAWVIGLGLLTLFFSNWLDRQENPNREVMAVTGADGVREVVLRRNRAGHYIASGTINGHAVVFLLDTGATDVALAEDLAKRLGLRREGTALSRTANGMVQSWTTSLESVEVGGLELRGVRASVLPNLHGDSVLLGMSYLKHVEMIQSGNKMVLRRG